MAEQRTIFRLRKGFDTDAKCFGRLERLRWPGGVRCPRCGGRRVSKFEARGKTGKKRRLYTCLACRYQYTATAGTVFHDSHLPLPKWFRAVFAWGAARQRVSAAQLQRALRLASYETAWFLARRIRRALERGDPLVAELAALGRRRRRVRRRRLLAVLPRLNLRRRPVRPVTGRRRPAARRTPKARSR